MYMHTHICIFIFSSFFTVDIMILLLFQVAIDIFLLSSAVGLGVKSSSVASVKNNINSLVFH